MPFYSFHEVPLTNFHEMDLDWIILKVKELDAKVNDQLYEAIDAYIEEHLSQFVLNASFNEAETTIYITEGGI